MAEDRSRLRIDWSPGMAVEGAGLFIATPGGRHPDRRLASYELIFCRSGRLAIAEDGGDVSIGAGQALLLRAGARHHGTDPYGADLSFYWLHFRYGKPGARPAEALHLAQRTTVVRPDRLTELFHRFLGDQEADLLAPGTAAAFVRLMLGELAVGPDAPPSSAAALLAGRAERYIATHLGRDLSASAIARALGVNADYLNRACREAFGLTTTQCVQRRAVREARILLRDGGLAIKQIARRCGFADATRLRRLFRRQEGMSPGAYRRMHARMHVNRD